MATSISVNKVCYNCVPCQYWLKWSGLLIVRTGFEPHLCQSTTIGQLNKALTLSAPGMLYHLH